MQEKCRNDFKGYDYSTDIETLCLSPKDCEDYISGIIAIKHSVQDPTAPNNPPEKFQIHAVADNTFEQQKSDGNKGKK